MVGYTAFGALLLGTIIILTTRVYVNGFQAISKKAALEKCRHGTSIDNIESGRITEHLYLSGPAVIVYEGECKI